MTEARLAKKFKTPKLNEAFAKEFRMLAEKYELRGQTRPGSASAPSGTGSKAASGKSGERRRMEAGTL